jgi:hypothetical protein
VLGARQPLRSKSLDGGTVFPNRRSLHVLPGADCTTAQACGNGTPTTLLNYLKLYNYHIPQCAIGTKTPIQPLKEWQQKKPELFVKRVYYQTGLDN